MARYVIRARGDAGLVDFLDRLTIVHALERARELRAAHFEHITLINVITGVEITDLEALMQENHRD